MSGPGKFLQTALRIGLPASGYRLLWELEKRSGLKRLRTPAGGVPIPSAMLDFETWLDELPAGHWLLGVRAKMGGGPTSGVTKQRAEDAIDGKFVLFGRDLVNVGDPPRWHLEPARGIEWPRSHWTRAIEAPVGDLRTTWEINRFRHVWDWVAAAKIADDPHFAVAFEKQLYSWAESNMFRAGVNWASGQEIAIRLLNLMLGGAAFGGAMSDAGFRRLVEVVYWHAFQLEAEFGFSKYAVPNNHLIAEAFGLAAAGDAFRAFEEASGWRSVGLGTLQHTVPRQFTDDGGYCQASTSYHRFALELLLWAEQWLGPHETDFTEVFRRSLRLFDVLRYEDGTVANFGPNDGARALYPGDTDARDYRPLVALLRARCGRLIAEDWRASCEATLFWCSPAEPQWGTVDTPDRQASFEEAGLHMLRSDDWSALLRCGPMPLRGGHSDALHVDVRHRSGSICVDRGSYRYLDPRHGDFVEAHFHNGVLVDGEEPRELLSRFTWSIGPEPVLEEFDASRGFAVGHLQLPGDFEWERQVAVDGDGVVVSDAVKPRGRELSDHSMQLHWMLAVPPSDIRWSIADDTVTVEFGEVTIEIVVRPVVGPLGEVTARVEPNTVSWYYGSVEPASSLMVEATGRGVRFESRFLCR